MGNEDVAVCPRCSGEKVVHDARSGQMKPCPTCNAAGVVWRTEESVEKFDPPGDPTELRGL